MKVQFHLDAGQTIAEAEDLMEKSLRIKKECSHEEKYASKFLNEFHEYVCSQHATSLEELTSKIKEEIETNAGKRQRH